MRRHSSYKRKFPQALPSHSNKPIPSHAPSWNVSRCWGRGQTDPIDERKSCFVIPCGSLTNHTGGEENRTPNCRQQGLPNPAGMDKKSCSTSQHCHCIFNPPASYTRRAWGQVSRAMLWKKQATPANSFCPFSSFYISFSTISSFTASPLPPSPPPAPRHPVKHVKPRQKETVCVCIASHDIFLYKVLVKL